MRVYFRGLLPNCDQESRLAVSADGLKFKVEEPLLGPPYFRAFQREGWIYTIAWGGGLWRSKDWHLPFSEGPQLIHYDPKEGIGEGFRHGETFVQGDSLFILFTSMGDAPERDWEGAGLAVTVSTRGAERHRVRELRDPCVFKNRDAKTYLFYCGAGESAIGIAELYVSG